MGCRALVTLALGGLLAIACDSTTPPEPTGRTAPAAAPTPAPGRASAPELTADPVTPVPAPPPAITKPVDSCGLTAKLSTTKRAGGRLEYTLTLRNGGDKPLSLVVPGDGSEHQRRTPKLTWSGTSDGKPSQEVEQVVCGWMNSIREDEIFTLAPGGSRALGGWIHGPSFVPGRHEVRLRYVNDPTEHSAATPEVAPLLARTSACDVTSAPRTIDLPEPVVHAPEAARGS